MTGANAKIKRILVRPNGVEKQVRPSGGGIQEYSYNFVQAGSISQIQSDGWVFNKSGVTVDSTGVYSTGGSSGADNAVLDVSGILDFSNAKKITMICNIYVNAGTWNGYGGSGIGDTGFSVWERANTASGSAGFGVTAPSGNYYDGTAFSTGSYTVTVVADLENKTLVGQCTNRNTVSYTLTQSDVDSIKTCTFLFLGFNNSGTRQKDYYIKIE